MSYIPSHIVDEIQQRTNIEDVIADFVSLKKAGSNLKGLSPFTDEKTPSFFVSPSKQIFKCFSTGKGGTAVTFLMEKEHFSYPEALRWLADKYGIIIPEQAKLSEEEQSALSEKETLYIVNEFANKHFQKTLHDTPEGKNIGYSYFIERGFRPDIIELFQLGYCLNSGYDLSRAAQQTGYKIDYFEKLGLLRNKNDSYFDFFRGRALFPIHSVSGRILGFGGRTLLADKNIAKYFNSPESPIYNKSEILYGLYFAKSEIIKQDNCFLCEGYTDVVSLYQSGIQNVVASSGTSLTVQQVRLIKRYTENITILYDGDNAGIKASFRGIDLILQEGLNVRVVLFPEGEDPDSFAKKVGSSELKDYLNEHQQDFISFKASVLLKDQQNDPIKKTKSISDILYSVAHIPNGITRRMFTEKISTDFRLPEITLHNELNTILSTLNVPKQEQNLQKASSSEKDTPEEYSLIRLLILYGTQDMIVSIINENNEEEEVKISVIQYICEELAVDELTFDTPIFAKIHQLYAEGLENDELHKASVLKRQADQQIVKVVADIETDEEFRKPSPAWRDKKRIFKTESDDLYTTVLHTIYVFKKHKIEQMMIQKQADIQTINPQSEEDLKVFQEKTMELMNLSRLRIELGNRIAQQPKTIG